LSSLEVENYLLDPEAITHVLREQCRAYEIDQSIETDEVARRLQEMLESEESKLYPHGRTNEAKKSIKGSVALERIFDSYQLPYQKNLHGPLIAEALKADASGLQELWSVLESFFQQ
jgi:hypothetical protein